MNGHTPSQWCTTAELVRAGWEASSWAPHMIWKSPMRAHRWALLGSLRSLDREWTVLRPNVCTAAAVAEVPHSVFAEACVMSLIQWLMNSVSEWELVLKWIQPSEFKVSLQIKGWSCIPDADNYLSFYLWKHKAIKCGTSAITGKMKWGNMLALFFSAQLVFMLKVYFKLGRIIGNTRGGSF